MWNSMLYRKIYLHYNLLATESWFSCNSMPGSILFLLPQHFTNTNKSSKNDMQFFSLVICNVVKSPWNMSVPVLTCCNSYKQSFHQPFSLKLRPKACRLSLLPCFSHVFSLLFVAGIGQQVIEERTVHWEVSTTSKKTFHRKMHALSVLLLSRSNLCPEDFHDMFQKHGSSLSLWSTHILMMVLLNLLSAVCEWVGLWEAPYIEVIESRSSGRGEFLGSELPWLVGCMCWCDCNWNYVN